MEKKSKLKVKDVQIKVVVKCKVIAYPPSVLQFGCVQNSALHLHHLSANADAKRLEVGVRIEIGLAHLATHRGRHTGQQSTSVFCTSFSQHRLFFAGFSPTRLAFPINSLAGFAPTGCKICVLAG